MLLLMLALSCPKPMMINQTKEPWSSWDKSRMHYCASHCSMEYDDAPCLKKFYKSGHQTYFCLCGKENK